jgi:hypothetical protein
MLMGVLCFVCSFKNDSLTTNLIAILAIQKVWLFKEVYLQTVYKFSSETEGSWSIL